jgi:hypothetical protein
MVEGRGAHRLVCPLQRALGGNQRWGRKLAGINQLRNILSVIGRNDEDRTILLQTGSEKNYVEIIEKRALHQP